MGAWSNSAPGGDSRRSTDESGKLSLDEGHRCATEGFNNHSGSFQSR
jgi:hypothetical protein